MSMPMPHDTVDLMLSPVALAIDARLAELGALESAELEARIVLETNSQPRNRTEAERSVVECVRYLIDTHHWDVGIDSRGIRMSHDDHGIVLGIPANVRSYLDTFAA